MRHWLSVVAAVAALGLAAAATAADQAQDKDAATAPADVLGAPAASPAPVAAPAASPAAGGPACIPAVVDGQATLGAGFGDLSPVLATMIGHRGIKGVVILAVAACSVAQRGDLEVGDTVTTFAGHPIATQGDMIAAVHAAKAGDTVTADVIRQARPITLTFTFKG